MEDKNKKLFFGADDFSLEISMGREYYANDLNFEIYYHSMDYAKSKKSNVYGQSKAKEKVFLPPVPLNAWVKYSGENTSNRNGMNIKRQDIDEFVCNVYNKELEEKELTLEIGNFLSFNHGDKRRYYEIESINFISDQNQSIFGQQPYYKRIVAIPAKADVVDRLMKIGHDLTHETKQNQNKTRGGEVDPNQPNGGFDYPLSFPL